MVAGRVPEAWVREVLERHDPLGAWAGGEVRSGPGEPRPDAAVAAVAAGRLDRLLGLGHIWTVVADALDEVHRGFYARRSWSGWAGRWTERRSA